MSPEPDETLAFLTAEAAEEHGTRPCVVIVRTREEFTRWLAKPDSSVQWLQVEGLLADKEVWAIAAQGTSQVPLDVILTNPAAEFSALYLLVDTRVVRGVRVTMPAAPGLMKALRVAASLQLPVRLLPGQPSAEALVELAEAARFYLRDPMVEAPVEFFHSLLVALRGTETGTLWMMLEEDPRVFSRLEPKRPPDFVESHLARLLERGAECATCRWQKVCAGYFKWPDPAYACAGIQQLFASIEAAAEEIGRDLAGHESSAT